MNEGPLYGVTAGENQGCMRKSDLHVVSGKLRFWPPVREKRREKKDEKEEQNP